MKLKDIKNNINKFNNNNIIDILEKNIEFSIKKTINNNRQYYYSKDYAKKFMEK